VEASEITRKGHLRRVGTRRYYTYLDENNVVVRIPNWYRWSLTVGGIVLLFEGIILGWYFT
jgi:hypothetical protein